MSSFVRRSVKCQTPTKNIETAPSGMAIVPSQIQTITDFQYAAILTVAVHGSAARGDGFVYVDSQSGSSARYHLINDDDVSWLPSKFREMLASEVSDDRASHVIVQKYNNALHIFKHSRQDAEAKVMSLSQ